MGVIKLPKIIISTDCYIHIRISDNPWLITVLFQD
jgi:hypothetical protein